MPYNLLLLPLLGGYLFIHFTYRFRFRAQGLENHRLIFESAGFGIAALVVSRLAAYLVDSADLLAEPIQRWKLFAPFSHSGSAAGAVLLGLTLPLVVNRFWDRETSSRLAIQTYGNDLERLLHGSWVKGERGTILITLANRKVYVAWIVVSPNLKPSMPFVTILPTMSGYRDKDTLEVRYTTRYTEIYRKIDEASEDVAGLTARSFQVAIPTSSIVSASPFSKLPPENFIIPPDVAPADRPPHAED